MSGPHALEHRLDQRGLRFYLRRRPVHLDQQHGGGVGRIARGVDRCLDCLDAGLVHHLERGRHHARGDDGRYGFARGAHAGKVGQQRPHCRGHGLEPHGNLGRDSEHSFAADEQADQVRAPGLALRRTEPDHARVGEHHLELSHVIGRDAVLEAMGPPAFSATFPPTVQAVWLDGSGTYCSPSGATASDSRAFTTPG